MSVEDRSVSRKRPSSDIADVLAISNVVGL